MEVRGQPGAAGTIVNNLVALGIGEVHAVGFCGDDGEGYELRRALAARPGVILEDFLTAASRRTPVYCKPMVIEPGQPPRELNRLDSKNWTPTPDDLQHELAAGSWRLADRVDALLLLDQVDLPETGVVTGPVKQRRACGARENPDLIVLADSRRGLRDFPPLGFKMNAAELARMTGSIAVGTRRRPAVRPPSWPAAPAGRSSSRWPSTASSAPCRAADPNTSPPIPVRGPIDIVGAGDSVTANLAAALASGADLARGHGTRHGRRLARHSPARDDRDRLRRPDRRIARRFVMRAVRSCPPSFARSGTVEVRIRNLLIVAFARNGTVIPCGEFLIEPDSHRLGVFIGVALLERIVTGEDMDGRFQALFCARPCHGLAGHLS